MRFAGLLLAAWPAACIAQTFTQRGYLETGLLAYPQAGIGDSGRAVGGAVLNYEVSYKLSPSLRLNGGIDARTDTHREAERTWGLTWWDRNRARPSLAVRRLSATYTKGPITLEVGKQFIRWGKADILNPSDRFAPRDYVNVVKNDFIGITAGRLTIANQSDSLELIFAPRLTPSRIPLIGQRWVILPQFPLNRQLPVLDTGGIPGGPQFGARWNHLSRVAEFSFSFYEGFNHLPLVDPRLVSRRLQLYADFKRFYPKMRMVGADAAIPLRFFTVKAEAAYFMDPRKQADEYMIYVAQLERQKGEWLFVGGYAGQYIAKKRSPFDFAPDRGLTRAFLGRAGYTIDATRSVAVESAVRQDGDGVWVKWEYTQSFGNHWRLTTGYTLIRGEASDFLGQFRRNSHGSLSIRYSF
jgi:hypothetical protein